MDQTREKLFADSGFALDQDRDVHLRGPLRQFNGFEHLGRRADDLDRLFGHVATWADRKRILPGKRAGPVRPQEKRRAAIGVVEHQPLQSLRLHVWRQQLWQVFLRNRFEIGDQFLPDQQLVRIRKACVVDTAAEQDAPVAVQKDD